jgi:hypothetical protein
MGRKILVNVQNTRLTDIGPAGLVPFFADGQTDGRTGVTRLKVAFRNCFAEAPKMTVRDEL